MNKIIILICYIFLIIGCSNEFHEATYCEEHLDCIDQKSCGDTPRCVNYDWWYNTSGYLRDCEPDGGACVCISNHCVPK